MEKKNIQNLLMILSYFLIMIAFSLLEAESIIGLAVLFSVTLFAVVILSKDLSWGLVIWILSFPFYRNFRLINSSAIPNISIDRIIWLMILLFFVIEILLRRRKIVKPGIIEGLMIIYLIICIFSMYNAETISNKDAFSDFLSRHLIPFSLFFIAKNLLDDETKIRRIFFTMAIAGTYMALTGIFEHFHMNSLIFPRYIADPNVGIHYGRARGPLLQAAANGTAMAMLFLISFHVFNYTKGLRKGILIFPLMLIPITIFFTYTRACYLGFGASLLTVALFYPRIKRFLIPVLPFAIIVGVYFSTTLTKDYSKARGPKDDLPIYDRLNLYATALNVFVHHPITGTGFYTFPKVSTKYVVEVVKLPRLWIGSQPTHNNFLEVLTDMGLVGIIPFVAIFISIFVMSLRWYRKCVSGLAPPQNQAKSQGIAGKSLVITFWGTLIVFLINVMFTVMNHLFVFAIVFIAAGIVAGLSAKTKEKQILNHA